MAYPVERREVVLRRLLPPNNISIAEPSSEEGISDATPLDKQARNESQLMPDADNSSASNWSSRDKFATVMETAAMSQIEIGEYEKVTSSPSKAKFKTKIRGVFSQLPA